MVVSVIKSVELFDEMRVGLTAPTQAVSTFSWKSESQALHAKRVRRAERRAAIAARAASRKQRVELFRKQQQQRKLWFAQYKLVQATRKLFHAQRMKKLGPFRRMVRGIHGLRESLYMAVSQPNNEAAKVRLAYSAQINAELLNGTTDPVLLYLLYGYNDALAVPSTKVAAWIRSTPRMRRRMQFQRRDKKSSRLQNYWVKFPISEPSVVSADDDVCSLRTIPKRVKRFDDLTQLRAADWVGVATCATYAVSAPKLRKIRERLAFAGIHNANDYIAIMRYIDITGRPKLVLQRKRWATCQAENDGAHGDGAVSVDAAQNVVITTARDTSGEVLPRLPSWVEHASEDVIASFPEIVDRWLPVSTVKWTTSHAFDSELLYMDMPRDAIRLANNADVINYIPFYSHQYWRGDMQIRVELNSNKFMVGQLQCSFYYGFDHNNDRSLYNNVYTLSQCQHGLLDAGGSNSVELIIPYKNHSAMVPTRSINAQKNMYIGIFKIRVIAPLSVGSDNVNSCNLVVYLRFANSEFTGQISRAISGVSQMESALVVAGAMRLLDTVASDFNRDNPPAVIPPAYVVPTATHSWAVGTNGADVLHPMRLDAGAQTHHPTGIDADQFTRTGDVARIWGLRAYFQWMASQAESAMVSSYDVRPARLNADSPAGDTLDVHIMTPVEVMSSMFAQWRGSIEYRFDIIASQFHTGRLLIAYIPNADRETNYTLAQAKSSYNAVFDLQEARTFTFVAPYVSNDPWARRRENMNGSDVHYCQCGKLIIYVLVPLVAPTTVAQSVQINMYMRAGSSFELSVLAQPTLGLAVERHTRTSGANTLTPPAGQETMYVGTWDGIYPDGGCVLRWGTLAGRVVQFPNADYWLNAMHANVDMFWRSTYKFALTVNNLPVVIEYFAVIRLDDTFHAVACATAADAVRLWKAYMKGEDSWRKYYGKWNTYSGYAPSTCKLTRYILQGAPQMERMMSGLSLGGIRHLPSTSHGRGFYGEDFSRLKDLCRRYQYAGGVIIPASHYFRRDLALLKYQATPMGFPLDLGTSQSPNYTANKCREGIIPLILSGFKYYRGSIRYRIVMPPHVSQYVWIQHRPDDTVPTNGIVDATAGEDEMCMLAHGYAMYLQHTDINGVIEFEVPFYQTGVYGLLGNPAHPADRPYVTNGLVVMGINAPETLKTDMKIDIYYCLGDDFNFNTFQGFPQMVDASTIAIAPPAPRRQDYVAAPLSAASSSSSLEMLELPPGSNLRTGTVEMEYVRNFIKTTTTDVVKEAVQDAATDVKRITDEAMQRVQESGFGSNEQQILVNIITNALHVAQNCTIGAIVTAIISVFACVGIKLYESYAIVKNMAVIILRKLGYTFNQEQSNVGVSYSQESNNVSFYSKDSRNPFKPGSRIVNGDPEDAPRPRVLRMATSHSEGDELPVYYEWITALYSAMCVGMGFKARDHSQPPIKQWANLLTKDVTNSARTGSAIISFIKMHIRVFQTMGDWLVHQFNPDVAQLKHFAGERAPVKIWIEEALFLQDVEISKMPCDNQMYIERLTACELYGRELLLTLIGTDTRRNSGTSGLVERLYGKVQKLMKEAIARGKCPYLRVKPIHVQLHGVAGIGKSQCVKEICRFILEDIQGYKIETPNYFCPVSAASKYWDQCDNQPAIVMDDLWAVNTPNTLESQLCTYFELYGDIPFTPPRAEADKKKERLNPQLFVSTTNYPQQIFPNVDVNALKRRRDLLLEVVAAPLDPEGHPDCPHCAGHSLGVTPSTHLNDYHHIIFYANNIFGVGDQTDRLGAPMSWLQLKTFMRNMLKPIWIKNMEIYRADIDKLVHLNPFDDNGSIEDRIERSRALMRLKYEQRHTSIFQKLKEASGALREEITKRYQSLLGMDDIIPIKKYSPAEEYCDAYAELNEALGTSQAPAEETVDWETCLRDYGKQHPKCMHAKPHFIRSYFVNGRYMVPSTDPFDFAESEVLEDYRCEPHCLLNDNSRLFASCWLEESTVKMRQFRMRNEVRIPKIILGSTISAATRRTKARELYEKLCLTYRTAIDKYLTGDSLIMKSLRWFTRLLRSVKNFIGKWLYIIGPIIAAVGGLLGGVVWWKNQDAPGDSEVGTEGIPESKAYNIRTERQATRRILRAGNSEAGISQQANVVEARIRRNSCYITMTYVDDCGNTKNVKFMCLMLYERRLLAQRHYIETIRQAPVNKIIRFRWVEDGGRMAFNPELGIEIDLLDCKMTDCEYTPGERDSNFVIVDMPASIPHVKNITKFFATNASHAFLSRKVLFVRPGASSTMVDMMVRNEGIMIRGLPDNRYSGPITLDITYEYEMSMPGYCGSIIMDMSLQNPIIGMHVCGIDGTKMGCAERLVYEAFHPAKPTRTIPVVDCTELNLGDIAEADVDITSMVFGMGVVPPKFAASQSGETQYEKSILHNVVLPNLTEPMPLTKHDPRMGGLDPLNLGCTKHGLASRQFKRATVQSARDHYANKILTLCNPCRQEVKPLSWQEAICGMPDRAEYAPLEWASSEGFPFNKHRPPTCRTKAWLFTFEETSKGKVLTGMYEPLRQMLIKELAMRKRGEKCDVINVDCLKDTCEPFEKARTPGKTRVFSTCPIQYLIVFKQYFGDFLAAFKNNRIFTEHAIGINVDGGQWTQLAKYLQEVGPSLVAGDYSHFGYTLNSQFMQAAFDVMFAWYDKYSTSSTHEEDQIIRGVIASEAINPQHLARNFLYQTQCGMASGFPATEVMNTMVNCMYIRAAWSEMLSEPMKLFDEHVRLMTYGDDVLANVSEEYIDRFNTMTLQNWFATQGIKFTDIDKFGKVIPYRSLHNAPFLKRNFKAHPNRPGLFLAQIDESSIAGCLNWTHKKDDPREAIKPNINSCMDLAYGHGPEYYEALRNKINVALQDVGIYHPTYSWYEIDNRNFQTDNTL